MGKGKENDRPSDSSAVYALLSVLAIRDPSTLSHSKKVNTYAVALAETIGLSSEEVSWVSTASLLHDIGKIGIPDAVLNKKSILTNEDWKTIKSHPKLGATVVGNVPYLAPCVNIILYHHERWDGNGYPEGLKGEQIPIESRIIAIANSYDAMTSNALYRPALALEETINELRKYAGSQFDPKLVDPFIRIVEVGLSVEEKITQD